MALKNACVSIWQRGKKCPSREKAVGESIARALTLRLSKRNQSFGRTKGGRRVSGKEKRKLRKCPEAVLFLPHDAI